VRHPLPCDHRLIIASIDAFEREEDRELAAAQGKLTARAIAARKGGAKLTMIAAYDYPIARLVERAGIEMILVGDSLGMTVLGYDSPVPVTLEDLIYHSRAVVRGALHTHIVADMPFLTYHASDEQALRNAGRLLQEGGVDSVKLEGGNASIVQRIRALVDAGIPVMGHIGMTPQSGGTAGFGTQGADVESALAVIAEAKAVAEAGAFSMVIEAVPAELAGLVTASVPVPTVGIGAGAQCDGQTVVSTDLLGIESKLFLKFSKQYAQLGEQIESAFRAYVDEASSGVFPGPELSISMDDDVLAALNARLATD
jgi:3-methyl-2-oxobutanoate hydroxymethyltransferase